MTGQWLLLFPAWGWAAAAVALPILIHLWSRGRGRTVPVASLRWFPEGRASRARRFRPSGWPQLLVRCLVLLLLALAIALPRWRGAARPEPESDGTWTLVDPEVWERRDELRASAPEAIGAISSGAEQGELRLLAPGLPAPAGEAGPTASTPADLWGWMLAADGAAPPGIRFRVVALDRIAALPGSRPTIRRDFEWLAVPEPAFNAWPVAGRESGSRFLRSEAAATRLAEGDGASAGDVLSGDDAARQAGEPIGVRVRSSSDRQADERIVRGALERLQESGWPLRIPPDGAGELDVEFLLGEGAEESSQARWVFRDGRGAERLCAGLVRPPDLVPAPFRVEWCTPEEGEGTTIWRAPDDRPLLVGSVAGGTHLFRFASRLDPAWSGLGDEGRLAAWLDASFREAGLGPPSAETPGSDRRAAALDEGSPRSGPHRSGAAERPVTRRWPELLIWAFLAFVLLAERRLSGRAS